MDHTTCNKAFEQHQSPESRVSITEAFITSLMLDDQVSLLQ